jgi:hypothetical protein
VYNNGSSNLTLAQVVVGVGNWSNDKQYYLNATADYLNDSTTLNSRLIPYMRNDMKGITNSSYDSEVLENENYFNSPYFGYGCYENWLLQSESFGTTWVRVNGTAITNDNARSIATNTTATVSKTYIQPKGTTEILATLEKIEKVDSLRNHKENIRYISNSKNKDSDITQLMAKVSKIGSKLADAQSHAAKYKEMSEIFND